MSLNQEICNMIAKMIRDQFGGLSVNDVFYNFDSHCLTIYDEVVKWITKDKAEQAAIELVYDNIIKYIKDTFNYKFLKRIPMYDKDTDKYRVIFAFGLTKKQESALSGYIQLTRNIK